MANYSRSTSSLAQYMREELNTVHNNEPQHDFNNFEAELDLYTNQTFVDFDTGEQTNFSQPASKPGSDSPTSTKTGEPASATSMMGEFSAMDFMNPGEFNFGDFNSTYASPTISNFPDSIGSLQPIQPNPQSAYPPVPQQHAHQHAAFHHAVGQPKAGEKRRATEAQVPSRTMTIEEASRIAAEEDKRRRNTAASARFRVKKKQREQALEKSAKDMSDKVQALEAKISQLETENQWLKKLVLEKNDATSKEGSSKGANVTKSEVKAELEKPAKEAGSKRSKSEESGSSS